MTQTDRAAPETAERHAQVSDDPLLKVGKDRRPAMGDRPEPRPARLGRGGGRSRGRPLHDARAARLARRPPPRRASHDPSAPRVHGLHRRPRHPRPARVGARLDERHDGGGLRADGGGVGARREPPMAAGITSSTCTWVAAAPSSSRLAARASTSWRRRSASAPTSTTAWAGSSPRWARRGRSIAGWISLPSAPRALARRSA